MNVSLLAFATIFFFWIVCMVIGYQLGKDRTIGGGPAVLLCAILGLLGVVIVLCFPKNPDYIIDEYYDTVVPQPSAPVAASITDELKKWHDLKEMGAITLEEFEERKKALLSRS